MLMLKNKLILKNKNIILMYFLKKYFKKQLFLKAEHYFILPSNILFNDFFKKI